VPVAVVKLGSSVVAHDTGELRLSVVARICEEVAVLHRKGVDVVVVTSGAIARGMRLLELPVRPTEIAELQAASAIGQGRLYRTYDELLRELGLQSAQVLLTFFDMSARSHYLTRGARCRRCSGGGSSPSSTRTTRRRRMRSPSATTTSSRPRSRCSSARSCSCC